MKWMKRLRLINWHYFKDEELEFGKQTLITGQNAAGKSTIIDALQVLFVADHRMIKFNAAAHDDAKRSFINYLRGKIGSDERSFLRDGDFTTYIAAEFRDEDRKEWFVVGVAIDVYRGSTTGEEEYFILSDRRLDDLQFVKSNGQLLNRDEFRKRYGGESVRVSGLSGKKALFERNKTNYQKALLARMGQLHDRFFTIFTKALSFKPIQNIRAFVYDYILDRKELQLDLMRQNFEIHERYRQELEHLQEKKLHLQSIRECYAQYAKYKETAIEQDYVIRRLKADYESENLEQTERDNVRLEEELRQLADDIDLAARLQAEARDKQQDAYQRWQNHAAEKRKKELNEDIARLTAQQSEGERLLLTYRRQIERELQLLANLYDWPDNPYWTWKPGERETLRSYQESLARLDAVARCGIIEVHEEEEWTRDLAEIGEGLTAWRDRMLVQHNQLQEKLGETDARIEELRTIIRDLEQQKRSYAEPVRQLKGILEERLRGRSAVWVFCEHMELKEELWRNAVEGYLNTQRFDLLVEPECFAEALSIYEREKRTYRLEGVGLVDTEKEKRYLGTAVTGSLALELQAEHPVIQAHVEHLLGKVMKAANEQELRHHRTAVTQSCMVYNNLVARQMRKEQYEVPFIGAKAIARQLEIRRSELVSAQDERRMLYAWGEHLSEWIGKLKETGCTKLADHLGLMRHIHECSEMLLQKTEELNGLDFSEAERLQAEYEQWKKDEQKWQQKWGSLLRKQTETESKKSEAEGKLHLLRIKVQEYEAAWRNWINEHGSEREAGAMQRYEEACNSSASTWQKIQNWEGSWKGQQTLRDSQFNKLQLMRQKYNIDQNFIADIQKVTNEDYDRLLETIEHLNIPEYQDKVAAALKESEEEFKSHFIFRLREAIEMARREFHELNYALRHFPFSDDKYHFEVSPSERYKRFYDAVMDPMLLEKGSLFELPDNDRTEVLHELFDLLVKGEAGQLEEFSDYRQYLDFDIIVTSGNGKYRFSQVLKEKSGGETQTPFYIAILASFHHLYSGKSTRLVIFDEAFNKMDEQRIQSSLRLIKQMGLQLIAAVPDEKMQHMAPEVSTTLFVSKHNYQCYVDMIDKWDNGAEDEMARAGAVEIAEYEAEAAAASNLSNVDNGKSPSADDADEGNGQGFLF
ncbi:ATPase [Paenibacillus sp. JMULE4]|uniref:ATP-binding protein n=1 Tax=Paenibacillus sp. JMULE4 TaxID=2518342 RepID=UPI0015770A3E|nr:SbcC/MukB-like Walker B domain-containing protein [Paenibacillus sp. JMULE4]NTZ17276.1 ATPase [Paenibacillus sp. JMULE4]